jgi:quinolinate synthase
VSTVTSLREEIQRLKTERNALILAHYYEEPDIQDIADEIGDSLFLALRGRSAPHPVILLAGVVFMGETVKILSPEKTVLVPDLGAGCSLVEHSPYLRYLKWRRDHPDAICVSYVNSSAEVKCISDVVCTSSNAEKIISAIPKDRRVLFGPDQHLGAFVAKRLGRPLILWPGACEVHVLFSERKLFELKNDMPDAVVIAHPECIDPVLAHADFIGSTSQLLEEVKRNKARKFIVATEDGILHQMRKVRPDAEFVQAPAEGSCACNQCPYMKMNSLEKIRNALRDLRPEVQVGPRQLELAKNSLSNMTKIMSGEAVQWPKEFQFKTNDPFVSA